MAYGNVGPVTIELVNGTTDDPLTYDGVSGTQICPGTVTFGAGGGSMKITWKKTQNVSDHVIYYLWFSGQNNSTWKGNIISNGASYETTGTTYASITSIGPGNTMTLDSGSWNVGDTITGDYYPPATGTVGATSGTEMTLSSSDGRWMSNAGKSVIGPKKPASAVTGYLKWFGNNVTELVLSDPGYQPPPPGLVLSFTDPAPTGQTWDEELPAGTTISTRFTATNTEGSVDSGWTDELTPRMQSYDADPGEAYAERALRLLTFTNRQHVYCGQQAEAKRDAAISGLVNAGYELDEILKYL